MLITRLELENFKSYAQASISFNSGTNAIIGSNGAGKSTLLEAIGFALFDHRPEGFKLASLLREGSRSGSVVVQFISSLDERMYEVERRFSGTTTARYRVYDVELAQVIAEGSQATRIWLHDHLRVDPEAKLGDLFEKTVGVPQGTLTAPFLEPASVRKSIFDPLLQVDEYRKASDKLLGTERYLRDRAGEAREEIARIEGQLTELPSLRDEDCALRQTIAELQGLTTALGGELAEARTELEAFDALEQRIRAVTGRLESARSKLPLQERQVSDAKQALLEAGTAVDQVESSRAGYAAYQAADVHLESLEAQRTARDELLKERHRLAGEETRLVERLDQLDRQLDEIAQAAERMKALIPTVERQTTLESALSEARADVVKLESAIRREKRAAEDLAQAEKEVQEIEAALHEAARLERDVVRTRTEIEDLAQAERRASEQCATARAEVERLNKQSATLTDAEGARCPTCETELTPEHRDELLARNEQRLEALQGEIATQEGQASAANREKKSRQNDLTRLQERLRRLPSEDDLHRASDRSARCQGGWEEARAEVAALEIAPDNVERLDQTLASLGDPRSEYQIHEHSVKRREAVEGERAATDAEQQQLAEQMAHIDEELSAHADLDRALGETRKAREQHRQAHDTYVANLNTAKQYEARQLRLQEVTKELQSLQVRLEELEEEHRSVSAGYDAEQHNRAKQQVSQLGNELAKAESQLGFSRDRLDDVVKRIGRLQVLQNTLADKQMERDELKTMLHIVEAVRRILREAGPYITRQLVYRISREASALYADIMDDYRGRLQWSEDYELALDVRGRTRTFRQLSGGEQMCAALALRLALLRECSAIDVAFFDEPTAHLDTDRREGLAEKIMQVKGFSQIFVISHDDTFERAAQSFIRIVKDENGSRLEAM